MCNIHFDLKAARSLKLVRELSEHKRRTDPGRRFARGAGPWPPRPSKSLEAMAARERERMDREAVFRPWNAPVAGFSSARVWGW